MPRIKRLVVPGYPHHVTQRGNRRQRTFFNQEDYETYRLLISKAKEKASIDIWAYCLMPNHVHFIVVPREEDSLANLFRDAHRQYTRKINLRNEWRGHLWQERFHSFVMDEPHLTAAVRYVEQNPVRAGLCKNPSEWPWSSTSAHLNGRNDLLVEVGPMLERFPDWQQYLCVGETEKTIESIHQHSSTGRPAGNKDFLASLERLTGRELCLKKAGRKKNAEMRLNR